MCAGLHQKERQQLMKIKAFYLRLSVSKTHNKPIPNSLTLHYLPRINAINPLHTKGSNIRPDSPAFVTLHRVVSASSMDKLVFGSREHARASEGVRFDVYFGEEKLLKGVFRRDEGEEWKMEYCNCVLEGGVVGIEVKAAEVWVEAEGMVVAMSEKAAVRRKRRDVGNWFPGLEEIPEEREVEDEMKREIRGSDGGDCGGEGKRNGKMEVMEAEMEGVRLAVDVGIWVVCLGVGCLVSSLTRIKLPLF